MVYCSDPKREYSEKATRDLADMGYKNVGDYVEGKNWMDTGLPTEGERRDDVGRNVFSDDLWGLTSARALRTRSKGPAAKGWFIFCEFGYKNN